MYVFGFNLCYACHLKLQVDGVRAGAKRLGGKPENGPMRESPLLLPDGELAHL